MRKRCTATRARAVEKLQAFNVADAAMLAARARTRLGRGEGRARAGADGDHALRQAAPSSTLRSARPTRPRFAPSRRAEAAHRPRERRAGAGVRREGAEARARQARRPRGTLRGERFRHRAGRGRHARDALRGMEHDKARYEKHRKKFDAAKAGPIAAALAKPLAPPKLDGERRAGLAATEAAIVKLADEASCRRPTRRSASGRPRRRAGAGRRKRSTRSLAASRASARSRSSPKNPAARRCSTS